MNRTMLEMSQMLEFHPVLKEENTSKTKYLNVLEYFVRKYSAKDSWSVQTFHLYIKKFLGDETYYSYGSSNLYKKFVSASKFLFFYRDCLMIDSIFICAYENKYKREKIFEELASMYPYPKQYQKKMRQVFDALYDSDTFIEKTEQIQYLKLCWDKNREYIKQKPVKIGITANMSAGKSTLLNALIGKKVNRTQNDACTAKIHYIVNKPFEDGFCYKMDEFLELDADYNALMRDNVNSSSSEITVGTRFRTIKEISQRIWLLDTPGVNSSRHKEHKLLTEETIRNVPLNLLVYLLNGENIGSDDDRKHLLFVLKHYHGKILFVVNKLDRYRKNEDSVEQTLKIVKEDLRNIGFKNPDVVPVSAYAAYLAKKKLFSEAFSEDEQDEYELLRRKMKSPEYQLDTYYPKEIKTSVQSSCDIEKHQLLFHSGLLCLENMIYGMDQEDPWYFYMKKYLEELTYNMR